MSAYPVKNKIAQLNNSGLLLTKLNQTRNSVSRNQILTEITNTNIKSGSKFTGSNLSFKNAFLQENEKLKEDCLKLEEKSKL